MKILLITPLYPPDIASHAPYVKELAVRLSSSDEVTILTYGHMPEQIPGVPIITIPKMLPSIVRVIRLTYAMWSMRRMYDCIYIQNGPSVELPLIVASFMTRTPFILHLGDEVALGNATKNSLYRTILRLAIRRSKKIIAHTDSMYHSEIPKNYSVDRVIKCNRPPSRPEILPFTHFPEKEFFEYESNWREHVNILQNTFTVYHE